jgi:hypothetical protein
MRLMIDDVKIERHSVSFEAYRYEGQEVSIPLTFPDVIFASRWWWRVVEVLHPPPDGLRSWVWPQPRIAERWSAAFSFPKVKRLTTPACAGAGAGTKTRRKRGTFGKFEASSDHW